MGKRYTNNDIMKRLDELERRFSIISGVILLYSIGVALIIGHFSIKGFQGDILLVLGIVCYASGIIYAKKKRIKL